MPLWFTGIRLEFRELGLTWIACSLPNDVQTCKTLLCIFLRSVGDVVISAFFPGTPLSSCSKTGLIRK